jgi:hypothetical protein
MIMKFDKVSAPRLEALLRFVHGGDNVIPDAVAGHQRVITVKKIEPAIVENWHVYGVTVEILESYCKPNYGGMFQVEPRFLVTVYDIVTKDPRSGE